MWVRAVKRLRRAYWRWARRYSGEMCQGCERPVRLGIASYWRASDELWNKIVGRPSGVLCPRCFTEKARGMGVRVAWLAMVEVEWDSRWQAERDEPMFSMPALDPTLSGGAPDQRGRRKGRRWWLRSKTAKCGDSEGNTPS